MRIAVLTLTRDRLPYTQHCFQTLRDNAGCEFDHYVLDQGSQDGTAEWLDDQATFADIVFFHGLKENIGCCKGWNMLLDWVEPEHYDAIVCFDNDCEVVTPNTLQKVVDLAVEYRMILAPRVDGLMYPPPALRRTTIAGYVLEEAAILGNIFMVIPCFIFTEMGFRWDERYAVWDGGESITPWFREQGGTCGYIPAFRVNHYKTTLGQVEDIPWYFERRVQEGGRAA